MDLYVAKRVLRPLLQPTPVLRLGGAAMVQPSSREQTKFGSLESFAALFEESLKHAEMRTGEVITAGRVEHSHVVANAGLKSEALPSRSRNLKMTRAKSKSRLATLCLLPSAAPATALAKPSTRYRQAPGPAELEKALESGDFVSGTHPLERSRAA